MKGKKKSKQQKSRWEDWEITSPTRVVSYPEGIAIEMILLIDFDIQLLLLPEKKGIRTKCRYANFRFQLNTVDEKGWQLFQLCALNSSTDR